MEHRISDDKNAIVADEPVALDPSLWTQIAGGLPRGGWNALESVPRSSRSEVEALPRGNW